ncbi:glycosyltransferase [Coraliomargarita sp. SDUM461004]|uniref:Glycosyltransferase n=1 Tax=Thalassobacterium sedimentorum TaxID=3041258 RepID=A0ABU1AIL0_9BACT|nr:glycosyltransferase [Coraliomargarita sp. SDUM461004]MDQ8194464.1 glycosyltransferase [Coraliomargarita sp. SDUM461004]
MQMLKVLCAPDVKPVPPTTPNNPTYSIIIPAYNEATELPATLHAIRSAMQTCTMPGECIVVDNNSSDATAHVALAHGADLVVHEPVNQIARARNAGTRQSCGQFLIFIDADTRIPAELLNTALQLLEQNTCVGGGSIIKFEGKVSHIGRCGIALWEQISKLTRTAAGSFLFCRRDAFDAVGGYDESLYASEEVRFSRQLKKWGKAKGLGFTILQHNPALTSARKLKWYSGPQILAWVALMILLPLAVRSRKLCGFWYNRPLSNE